MSKNEEKERKNSKGQKKDNKLTKGNKKPLNDNKSPLKEGKKTDDILNAFPNFSALTDDERLAFFQALTVARKNVEKRGVIIRQQFGTVHDEYLKHFNQEEKEEKKGFANAKDIPSLKSSLTIHDGNASSCSDQSSLKFYNRNPSEGGPDLPTPLFEENAKTLQKNSFLMSKEKKPGPWEKCESIIQENTSQMVDLYLIKKKRNEARSNIAQLVRSKSAKKEIPEVRKEENSDASKKRKESIQICTPAKTTLKVRNIPKFNALSTEEKDIFFRTLQEARSTVNKINPEKTKGVLPTSAFMRKYQGDREAGTIFTTTQEPRRGQDGRKNLRVKVTLTSKDNERLNKTKSQVLSDAVRKTSDRKHKSAESLSAEGKEPSVKCELQPESFPWNAEKTSKVSLESCDNNSPKLKKGKDTTKRNTEKEEKKYKETKKSQVKTKKKNARKPEKLSRPEPSSLNFEPKISDSLKVNISNSSLLAEKKNIIKAIKKENAILAKKRLKTEKQKKKKNKKKEETQGEQKLKTENFFPSKVTKSDLQEKKDSNGWELTKGQWETKAEKKCEITEMTETHKNADKEYCEVAEVNPTFIAEKLSENNCKKDSVEKEESTTMIKQTGKSVSDEEQKEKCESKIDRQEDGEKAKEEEEKEEEPDPEIEQNEKVPMTEKINEEAEELAEDMNCESLRSLEDLLKEITDSVSNISSITESLEETNASVLDDDNDCEGEREKKSSEIQRQLMGVNLEEVTVETNAQKEIKGTILVKEKCREEEEIKKIATEFPSGKVMLIDDNVVEKIRKLIYYLETKVQKDGHLEKEYLQLVVDYVDYLSKVLESLVRREERNYKQVHDTYTAAEVHLQFEEKDSKKEITQTEELKNEHFPLSVSDQNFKKEHWKFDVKTSEENLKEKSSNDKLEPMLSDLESSTDSETEAHFTPTYSESKKVLTTKIRLLQDLLRQRAEFVEGSIGDFKIIQHPELEDVIPAEKPPTVQIITEEDEEDVQQDKKMKFFKILLRCCGCGKKKIDEDGIFENLKGEAVRVEMYEEKKIDPTSATLNQSTMEVLKATERKKVIEKYYSQD